MNDLTFPENTSYTKDAYTILRDYARKLHKPRIKEFFSLKLVPIAKEDTSTKTSGYIYLIRKREHVRMGEYVFKHGKTKTNEPTLVLERLKAYDKGGESYYTRKVDVEKVDEIETKITKAFGRMFEKHSDGRESFIGNPSDMIREIEKIYIYIYIYITCDYIRGADQLCSTTITLKHGCTIHR
jgi:hypothetical protein